MCVWCVVGVSSATEGRVRVWLQVRVETQRLRFQSGSTVVLRRPSKVKVLPSEERNFTFIAREGEELELIL